MTLRNSAEAYGLIAKLLHWTIAILVLLAIALAWTIDTLPDGDAKMQVFDLHRSVGLTVLAAALLRLVWRVFNPQPPMPPGTAWWEILPARVVQWFFYLVLIAMPISGWIFSNAEGPGVNYFGLLKLPRLVEKDKGLADLVGTIHGTTAIVILIALGLHVAGALRHHFLKRDLVLTRMLPNLASRGKRAPAPPSRSQRGPVS